MFLLTGILSFCVENFIDSTYTSLLSVNFKLLIVVVPLFSAVILYVIVSPLFALSEYVLTIVDESTIVCVGLDTSLPSTDIIFFVNSWSNFTFVLTVDVLDSGSVSSESIVALLENSDTSAISA